MISNKKLNIKRIAIIIGVIILPLLYSFFYLDAFWDPYSRLETLPVAIVNNDEGAEINGEDRNIGEEFVEELLDDASLGYVVVDEETAEEGLDDGTYYASITIPEDFSSDIASSSTTDKETATITYSTNQKTNYLASQILSKAVLQMESSIRESVTEEIVDTLTDQIEEIPDQMEELEDGLSELYDGSSELSDGASDLADGTSEFSDQFDLFEDGITTLQSGAETLVSGMDSLDSGLSELLTGINTITDSTEDLDDLTTGAQTLASSAEEFNSSLETYTSSVQTLVTSLETMVETLQYMYTYDTTLQSDPYFVSFMTSLSSSISTDDLEDLYDASTQIQDASDQITAACEQLADGTSSLPELKAALIELQEGISSAKDGSSELLSGTEDLQDGIVEVADATSELSDAADTIASGASDLSDGAEELTDGISTAEDSVSESISDSESDLEVLQGLGSFAAASVIIDEDDTVSVDNYGTAFAPYFLSLSLWVGGLMIFVGIFYDPDNKFHILSRTSNHRIARCFIYLGIGLGQALALGIILMYALGLEVSNVPLYFFSCCLVSVVFISIIQFLMVHLKDIGKFISMVLLILQLTSCGGTFPMETIPDFFNVLYPFMPMTYSVGLFKQSISGVNSSDLAKDIAVLLAFLIVFIALTIFISFLKIKKLKATDEEQEYELIEETN